MKSNKKNVKIIALTIVAFFTLGIVGLALSQSSIGFAAPSSSAIGFINMNKVIQNHPGLQKVQEAMQVEQENAQKDFANAQNLPEQEKQLFATQLQQRIQQKYTSLMEDLQKDIIDAAKKIADKKGLVVVINEDMVLYGGTDITDDVIKSFATKK